MPEFKFLEYRSSGGMAAVTISRPPHNVLDIPTMAELDAAINLAERDQTIKVLMITAAGEKAFSSGVDVMDHTPDKVVDMINTFHGLLTRLTRFPVPTIAALNGAALGGGCELAIACDMIVAKEGARIGQPEIRLGVFPPIAAILLPKMTSIAKVMELLLGGGLIIAEEAKSLGLVNQVFPAERFSEDCAAFAEQFVGLSRVALMYTKKAVREALDKPFPLALADLERIYLKELMSTHDAIEGLKSFIEKRKPVWANQ